MSGISFTSGSSYTILINNSLSVNIRKPKSINVFSYIMILGLAQNLPLIFLLIIMSLDIIFLT